MGKRIKKKTMYAIILSVMLFCFIMIVFLLLFQIRSIEVKGNKYLTEQEITEWIQEDEFSTNSVYLLGKYYLTEQELLPAMESVKISMKSPWSVAIDVEEKKIVGYIIVGDDFVYFDESGIVLEKSREWRDDVPWIEGLDVKNVELYKELPVSKESKKMFKQLLEMSESLKKYELAPSKIICDGSALYLKFGSVYMNLGNENFTERISQIPPILEKLGDQTGTLHLENYGESNTTISFENGVIPEEKKEKTDESE